LNLRQKRLFEEARKKNPNLKVPEESPRDTGELTEEDLALIKQGVGDKTGRASSAGQAEGSGEEEYVSGESTGTIVKYFDEKGFGFIRPDDGGRDVFFHISRLVEGDSTSLAPNRKVAFEVAPDKYGKMAAANVRILPE
jgi:CspA family cold shock protein